MKPDISLSFHLWLLAKADDAYWMRLRTHLIEPFGRGHSFPQFGSGELGGVGVFSRGKPGAAAGGASEVASSQEFEVLTDLSKQYFISLVG